MSVVAMKRLFVDYESISDLSLIEREAMSRGIKKLTTKKK